MKAQRVFRPSQKTPAQRPRQKALRGRLHEEKPSLDDLVKKGDTDPDTVMTMGMYFDIQRALQSLKHERLRRGLSIADVAERSGIDRAVISRLENGKQDNPTVATLMRYAAAIGKRFVWGYEDVERKNRPAGAGDAHARRKKTGSACLHSTINPKTPRSASPSTAPPCSSARGANRAR
jgi:transcriptional regulator with XRE-family HTH domain